MGCGWATRSPISTTGVSERHPIIAVTGSSGAGTSTASQAFATIFQRLGIRAANIEGDSFHAFDRQQMQAAIQRARIRGENFSHFGPASNHFDKLEALFRQYAEDGSGMRRRYLHTDEEAAAFGQEAGTFTDWEQLPPDTDVLFYEGLHGGVITPRVNVAQYVDLLIGMTPTINLEWIQKIDRDTRERGYKPEDVAKTILRRMPDYVNYVVPQFSRTDVNFQRVPLVDTSNPFHTTRVPSNKESFVVVHFARIYKVPLDIDHLVHTIPGAFMSRENTLVVPGPHMQAAMERVLEPMVQRLLDQRAHCRRTTQQGA